MAINFPVSIDELTNPDAAGGDTLLSVPHDAQHGTANDILEALEAKVGIDSSAVATSHDYLLAGLETDKANVDQTMYIGTTAVAINRASATLNLAGIGTLGVGAITATSYGGITEANLLDKTASETITGSKWIFNYDSSTIWETEISAYIKSYSAYDIIAEGEPRFQFKRSRGVIGTPTAVSDNTLLGSFQYRGYAGATDEFKVAASIQVFVDGTVDDDPYKMPGRLEFYTTGVAADATPTLALTLDSSQNAVFAGTVGFNSEVDGGSETGNFTIDFSTAQKQKTTLTENVMTITLDTTNITVGNYVLKVVNGGLATITWAAESGSIKWATGAIPSLTSSGTDIITIYFDGTDFYCQASFDFS